MEMLEVLLGEEGKRKLRLRKETTANLFELYESEIRLRHRSDEGFDEDKRVLGHFHTYLGDRQPTPELATSFLAQFAAYKTTTLYRYHSIINGFMTWYGEPLSTRIKVP
ncbi:MAG: hypothetical protein GY867_10745, partial [bacterium]|nr:hypothetical protein [bacterium]